MQKEEYLIKNACYSVTKYYLCKRNNKRSLSGRKQRLEVVRSFPNRYQFSCINKVTSLFSNRYIFIIILQCKKGAFVFQTLGWLFYICIYSRLKAIVSGRKTTVFCLFIDNHCHLLQLQSRWQM